MEIQIFRSESRRSEIKYILSYPKNHNKGTKHPILIHLHGAGGRGNDLELLKQAGPLLEIENGWEIPIAVAAPQCKADTWFDIMEQLVSFISNIIEQKDIDKDRVYLSGNSMGGYACWTIAMMHPEWFAAIIPVCGGGMYWNAAKLKHIPIWAFHGEIDEIVSVNESKNMVNAVNKEGGNAKLTIYPNTAHDSWIQAFGNDELYKWLLNNNRRSSHDNGAPDDRYTVRYTYFDEWVGLIDEFVDCIRNNKMPKINLRWHRKTIEARCTCSRW